MVLNKVDRLPPGEAQIDTLRQRLLGAAEHKDAARAAGVSALSGEGIDCLLRLIDEVLPFDPVVRARFRLAAGDGASIHLLHRFGRVTHTRYEDEHCIIDAEVSQSLKERLAEYAVGQERSSQSASVAGEQAHSQPNRWIEVGDLGELGCAIKTLGSHQAAGEFVRHAELMRREVVRH